MRRRLLFGTMSLVLLVTLAGCGSSGAGETPGPDTAADVAGGDSSGVPDGNVEDVGNLPETTEDTGGGPDVCTCTETNACCDGCRPINEGGDCDDFSLCETGGSCAAGACVGNGEPVACDTPAPCQEAPGVCDPTTGECTYAASPDGAECDATEGIDGSGLCVAGACRGFGDCDHRVYDQPLAYACNFDGDCESGWCLPWGDEWAGYCTRACGESLEPCPEGMFCVNGGPELGRFCRPLNRDGLLPGDGTQQLFAVCNDDDDCAGGLCLALNGTRFCTQDCESQTTPGTADAALCGDCGRCRDNGDELGFIYKFYCSAQGSGRLGDPCAWGGDCSSRFCQSGFCSEQCILIGEVDSCPDYMTCTPGLLSDPDIHVCVPSAVLGRALGESCEGDFACPEGLVCMEVLGEQVCSMDCAGEEEDLDCGDGVCIDVAQGEKACVPAATLGVVSYGGPCAATFQCADELTCYRGVCLAACAGDEDCDGMGCAPDAWYRTAYCAPSCVEDTDCPERMSCVAGVCLIHGDGQFNVGSSCRSDVDCRTGLCAGGICSDTCSETLPCEASVELPVPDWGLCKPCDPNNFGLECDEDWGLSECIQGIDGAYFCATECFFRGPGVCPVGTRCYSTGGYSAVCAPISGSCSMPAAECTSRGICSQPLPETMPCLEDADCGLGVCVGGRCDGPDCAADEDCECDLLVCTEGRCEVDAGAGLAETEPNDELADAQVLAATHQVVLGTLIALEGAPDIDLYSVPLAAGDVLDVWTSPFCGQYADTRVRFFTADGTPIEDWVFDSIDPSYPFSILNGYTATEAGTVVIEVTQGGMVLGNARASYVLDVNVFQPVENDACEEAIALATDGVPVTFDLAAANPDMMAPSCTGANAMGKDMAFAVTVPAGTLLTAHADTPFDSLIYLVSDCADVDASCVAGADVVWEGGPETLVYANETADEQELVFVVDSFLPESDMLFAVMATLTPIDSVANDTVANAVAIGYGTATIEAGTVGATDSYDTGVEGCVGAALPGRDIAYVAELAPGDFLTVSTEVYAGVNPVLLLTLDPTDPEGCLAVAQGMVHYRNTGATAETVYLIVDGLPTDGYGVFTLSTYMGHPAECFGPCEAGSTPWACVEGSTTDLCWCDQQTGTLTPFDCDAYCQDDGATSGVCHSFTAPGFERDSCKCDYDCSLANDHCERSIYTNCTCGTADPCDWVENGGCDEFCEVEYPGDFFDDSVDCTPAPGSGL